MDNMPDTYPNLFWASIVFWAFLAGYALCIGLRLRRIEKKLKDAEKSKE